MDRHNRLLSMAQQSYEEFGTQDFLDVPKKRENETDVFMAQRFQSASLSSRFIPGSQAQSSQDNHSCAALSFETLREKRRSNGT